MPRTSKKAGEALVNCPVLHCRRNLKLQPHPTLPGRVMAVCNCGGPHAGLPVYETNIKSEGGEIEAAPAVETEKQEE
jgi:hypothetical protein